eukprot:6213530-Pleurochrysis_carterae.AAC.2
MAHVRGLEWSLPKHGLDRIDQETLEHNLCPSAHDEAKATHRHEEVCNKSCHRTVRQRNQYEPVKVSSFQQSEEYASFNPPMSAKACERP